MPTGLFRGPICLVRNFFVDVKTDGTTALTAGQVNAPVNTQSAGLTHHAHRAHHHHKSPIHRVSSPPITMVVYDLKKVVRMFYATAVLKVRRDELVLAWETWEELNDLNKTKAPDHSLRPDFLKGRFFGATTVETGDIHKVLKTAKVLADQSMKEFLAVCQYHPENSWAYIIGMREDGRKHLHAMAKIYSRAAEINVHVRQQADKVERIVKTAKLSCDVLVNVIGTLVGNKGKILGHSITSSPSDKAGNAAFIIDVSYSLLTQETIGEHLWGVSPEMVGFEAHDHVKDRGAETANDVAASGIKEFFNRVSEFMKESMGEKAENIMERHLGEKGDKYLETLATAREAIQKEAFAIWERFSKIGKLSGGALGRVSGQAEALAAKQAEYKAAKLFAEGATMGGRNLSRALQGARWVWVTVQVIQKCDEIKAVWAAPIEDEEVKPEKEKEAGAAAQE